MVSLLDIICAPGALVRVPVAMAEDIRRGAVSFVIPEACGHSARSIERELEKRGVEVWGMQAYRDVITFETNNEKVTMSVLDGMGIG